MYSAVQRGVSAAASLALIDLNGLDKIMGTRVNIRQRYKLYPGHCNCLNIVLSNLLQDNGIGLSLSPTEVHCKTAIKQSVLLINAFVDYFTM